MEFCSYTFADPQNVPLNQLQFGFDLKMAENANWPKKLNQKWTLFVSHSFQGFNFVATNLKEKMKHSYLRQGCSAGKGQEVNNKI